jgi:hypothetical protein
MKSLISKLGILSRLLPHLKMDGGVENCWMKRGDSQVAMSSRAISCVCSDYIFVDPIARFEVLCLLFSVIFDMTFCVLFDVR